MILFKHPADLQAYITKTSTINKRIGFVPTMGALHEGHLSLIAQSKQRATITVCSIFINPTQFNDQQDFVKYPVTLDKDIQALVTAGCDILFLPRLIDIYPNGTGNLEQYSLGRLEDILEGHYRPGHFQGVCQVVNRLLDAVGPDMLFLGQKDYQQCMVIDKLIELTNRRIELVKAPTLRETDGLAMSSRNTRLDPVSRANATAIFNALQFLKANLQVGSTTHLINQAKTQILDAGFEQIDYISIAHAQTLELIDYWDGSSPCVALIAAFIGGVRLIDNLPLHP